jgi:hypothetical protein
MCHSPQTPRHLFEAAMDASLRVTTGGLGGMAHPTQLFLLFLFFPCLIGEEHEPR